MLLLFVGIRIQLAIGNSATSAARYSKINLDVVLSCLNINFGSFWWPSTNEMSAALLYPLGPTYLGSWGYREGVRCLAAPRELGSNRRHIYDGKNFKFDFYGFCIKPNAFVS